MRECSLRHSDRVLVKKKLVFRGMHKLANRWEVMVYIVVRQLTDDTPEYLVKPEFNNGPSRTLHRNLLFPCRISRAVSAQPTESLPPPKELNPLHLYLLNHFHMRRAASMTTSKWTSKYSK